MPLVFHNLALCRQDFGCVALTLSLLSEGKIQTFG